DGDSEDTGTAVHVARPGNNYTDPNSHQTYTASDDLMNPVYWFGRRYLVSATDVLILKDVYGYSTQSPGSFGSGGSNPPPERHTVAILATGISTPGGPRVEVHDATGAFKFSFQAYDASFTGGVRVAVGRINGNNTPVIVTAPGPGGLPLVRLFDGA